MQESNKPSSSRKKFLYWGAAILSSITFLKFIPSSKKDKKETVKMLTQDGKLVEIDKSLLATKGEKINNKELQQWIKNK